MILTSTNLRVGDFIIYGTPQDGTFVSKVLVINSETFQVRDIVPFAVVDHLSDDYGWQLYGKARSLRTLQKRYPEYFI